MSNWRQKRGKEGEDLAVQFLKKKGYSILCRNFKSNKKEIDIIAKKNNLFSFIEVKLESLGWPSDKRVDYKKRQHIIQCSKDYMEQNALEENYSFDILRVIKKEDKYSFYLIENAFNEFGFKNPF